MVNVANAIVPPFLIMNDTCKFKFILSSKDYDIYDLFELRNKLLFHTTSFVIKIVISFYFCLYTLFSQLYDLHLGYTMHIILHLLLK